MKVVRQGSENVVCPSVHFEGSNRRVLNVLRVDARHHRGFVVSVNDVVRFKKLLKDSKCVGGQILHDGRNISVVVIERNGLGDRRLSIIVSLLVLPSSWYIGGTGSSWKLWRSRSSYGGGIEPNSYKGKGSSSS